MKTEVADLVKKGIVRLVLGMVIIGALIFLPAGSLSFWNGWLYLISILALISYGFIWMYKFDPKLLERRLRAREKERTQVVFILLSSVLIVGIFILPGLDYRYSWSHVPPAAVGAAEVLFLSSYFAMLRVMKENRYASRVVEVEEEQRVVDSGMYGVVRHPMYMAMSVFYMSASVVLGSYVGLIPGILLAFLLTMRIKNEEKVLERDWKGYREYKEKVKYKMIPYIW
jgi:protein-S-isoprenylcysteine O-methyltransferase Ste14